ncbi:hypothetical protein LCGC14_3156120, partial [marine sediment metagenome]
IKRLRFGELGIKMINTTIEEKKEEIIDALEGKKTFNIEVDKKMIRVKLDDNKKSLRKFLLQFHLSSKQGRKMLIKKYAKRE